jgi:asparagine synthase (glutamine-hydrolysing)
MDSLQPLPDRAYTSRIMEKFCWSARPAAEDISGVTSLDSTDGNLRVVVLGDSRASSAAESLLKSVISGQSAADLARNLEVGYVIQDLRTGRSTVVAAPIALRQIFWGAPGGNLHVSSEAARCAGGGAAALSPDALYQYIYFHFLPGPGSAFNGVQKLGAGHLLEWQGGAATVRRYWQPSFAPDASLTLEAATGELRRILADSVTRGLSRGDRCGTFLSGGLDSSTVTGYAAQAQPGIPSISMGFDAEGYDEMHYARIASRRFGTRPLEYYVTPDDLLATLPDVAAAFSEPFGNSSAAAAFHCARIAREQGLDTLLAGDGGDELFGGNERYATQMVFERYGRVPRLLRALLEPAVGAAAKVTRRFPIGKAQGYIRQAKTPLPDRMQEYNFLHRMSPHEIFDGDLLRHVDRETPLRLLREEYHAPADADVMSRMLFLDWRFTLHDNDLVKVNAMCDLAGVRVAYPMLDPELIEFSLRIRSDWKVRKGVLRWLYKESMQGFLPDEIIHKTKHGFGLPFGTWTRTHSGLQKLSEDALQSLAKRRFFRPEFITEIQRLHREGHASYYGEFVWILMVLELWLQRHAPRAEL